MKLKSDADIPCATCPLWNQETKSFSCDPNKCDKLSGWLLKHTRNSTDRLQIENVQYIV
jgi:hypothetical protein